MYELWFSPDAVQALRGMEALGLERELGLTRRTLARLERDPFDPRMRTRHFATEGFGHVRATPVGSEDWHILWQARGTPTRLEVVHIVEVPL